MRPACPTCGSRMLLVRIFPHKPGRDQHTYECPRCADEITEIVHFVKAEALGSSLALHAALPSTEMAARRYGDGVEGFHENGR